MSRTTPIAAMCLLFLIVAPVQAGLIVNGSFEDPVLTAGSYEVFNIGSGSLTGWEVIGNDGNVSTVEASYTIASGLFPAHSGNQWLDLTGIDNKRTGIRQTVSTTPGADYTLTFWVGNIYGAFWGPASKVSLHINGNYIGDYTNSLPTPTLVLVWQQFSYSFQATGTSTSVAFYNEDPDSTAQPPYGDNSNGLDDVELVQSSVPEPSALLLTGGALLVLARLRSRR